MTRLPRRLAVALLLLQPACGDDADPAADTEAGTGDGDDSSGGDAVACEAAVVREVVAPDVALLSALTIADDGLVVLVSDPTFAGPTAIDRVGFDGGGRTSLHTSTADRRVVSLFAFGDTAYFLERDDAAVIPVAELWRVPLAGGAAERVGDAAFEEAAIVGVDAEGIFVRRGTNDPVGSVFERIDPTSGVVTTVGASVDTGTPLQPRVTADDLVFVAGGVGADAGGPLRVFALPKRGEGGTPAVLWTVDVADDPCGFPLGGLYPTPTRLACGFSGVATRALDGTTPEVLIDPDPLQPLNVLVATDAEALYVIDTVPNTSRDGHMSRLTTDDPTPSAVACGLSKVAYRLVDGFFPNQTEWEVRVGPADVYWIEESFDGTTLRFAIRAAPK
jgi:hypothetical protein